MSHGKGHIPDPAGHLTTGFHVLRAKLAASTPDSVSLEQFAPPVMDQGATSACVGHGTATAIYTSLAANGRKLSFVPSPRGIYTLARAIDRTDEKVLLTDDGSMPNQAMRGLTEWGVHPIEAPTLDGRYSDCDLGNINDEPQLLELEVDADVALVGWYRIDSTGPQRIFDIRSALAKGWCVGNGTFVASTFENWQAGDPAVGAQDETDPNGGGHWTCYLGYRTVGARTEILDRNSWGAWGLRGDIWVREEFVQQNSDLYAFAVQVTEAA